MTTAAVGGFALAVWTVVRSGRWWKWLLADVPQSRLWKNRTGRANRDGGGLQRRHIVGGQHGIVASVACPILPEAGDAWLLDARRAAFP
jgi:hypothetical protein